MPKVGLEQWPFTSEAGTQTTEPASHFMNWLHSLLFNNVHLLNISEIICSYIQRIADRLLLPVYTLASQCSHTSVM